MLDYPNVILQKQGFRVWDWVEKQRGWKNDWNRYAAQIIKEMVLVLCG